MDFNQRLYSTIENLRTMLRLNHKQWAPILSMSQKEYFKTYLQRKELSIESLKSICHATNVSMDKLMLGNIDYSAAVFYFRGDKEYIPELYTVAAFSRKKTLDNSITYFGDAFGWRSTEIALRHLQIPRTALLKKDMPVNINLMVDLLRFYRTSYCSDSHLYRMGASFLFSNRGTALDKALQKNKKPKEVYEHVAIELMPFFEKNCVYTIEKISDTNCIVKSEGAAEVKELLKSKRIGAQEVCISRTGLMSSLPGFINLPNAQVTEMSCVHRGDSLCRFNINYEKAYAVSRSPNKRFKGSRGFLHLV